METVKLSSKGLTPKTLFPKVTAREVRGFLAKRGRTLPDDADIKARIKARLKAQDDASPKVQ